MYPNKINEKCPKCYKEKELAIFKYNETKATLCLDCLKGYISTMINEKIGSMYSLNQMCPICERKMQLAYLKYEKVKSNICLNCAEKYIEEIIKDK